MNHHIEFDLDFKRNPYKGKLIVIEGIDGSGKTTQVSRLAAALSKKHSVHVAKNPTDGHIGQLIRKVLRSKIDMSPVALQYLFAADRDEQQTEIITYLKRGETVILDRYFWSAVAYGSLDQKGDHLLIAQSIFSFYHQHLLPDKTFFLQILVKEAMKRLKKKAIKEMYEEEQKLQKVQKSCEWLAAKFPTEIEVVDGTKPEKEVTQSILSKLEA